MAEEIKPDEQCAYTRINRAEGKESNLTDALTAPSSPFQNVRTNGRAFNSPNWRMKGESSTSSPGPASPSPRPSRTSFGRPAGHIPQAIAEGRRLYVGNMPYTAKSEDVEALFKAAEFPMYVDPGCSLSLLLFCDPCCTNLT